MCEVKDSIGRAEREEVCGRGSWESRSYTHNHKKHFPYNIKISAKSLSGDPKGILKTSKIERKFFSFIEKLIDFCVIQESILRLGEICQPF